MAKMSEAQRRAILDAHERQLGRIGYGSVSTNPGTLAVLRREGWVWKVLATYNKPTPSGLRAAGIDLDALHAEALAEHCDRLGILDEPNSPRGRTFAQAVYGSTDGTYASALDVLHAEALELDVQMTAGRALIEQAAQQLDVDIEEPEERPYVPGHPLADQITAMRARAIEETRTAIDRGQHLIHNRYENDLIARECAMLANPDTYRQCLRKFMPGHERHTDGITPDCHLSPSCPRDDHPHLVASSMRCFDEPLPPGSEPGFDNTGVTCVRMDGEHLRHGYARVGMGCAPAPELHNLDRQPQYRQAVNIDGWALWQHRCGTTRAWNVPPESAWCSWCTVGGRVWVPLYVRVPNTPAEARTGMSDRVAAALEELSALGILLESWDDHDRRPYARAHLGRAAELLRAEVGR